eukprot:gene14316-43_t
MEEATTVAASLQQSHAAISDNSSFSGSDGTTVASALQPPPPAPKLLPDNISKAVLKEQQHGGHHQHNRDKQRVSMSGEAGLAAAVGGLLALTGSVLSYALVRVREGKRVRVLTASRANLEAMTRDLETAREASCKIEADMAAYQDQLQARDSTQQQIMDAMTAAEQRVQQADHARQEAEARWKKAFDALDSTQAELESLKGELGLRGSQLEGLTRELEFTRRQVALVPVLHIIELANAEKRVERAMMESRSRRTGYNADYDWD